MRSIHRLFRCLLFLVLSTPPRWGCTASNLVPPMFYPEMYLVPPMFYPEMYFVPPMFYPEMYLVPPLFYLVMYPVPPMFYPEMTPFDQLVPLIKVRLINRNDILTSTRSRKYRKSMNQAGVICPLIRQTKTMNP